jgi:NAD(P)-dependent dehydrogenase (short-subunit alcohol dehydrogenase family)
MKRRSRRNEGKKMSLLAAIKRLGPNGFGFQSTAEQVTEGVDLTGKTFLLTGCNSGLGQEALRVLSLRGAHVIACARTKDRAASTIAELSVSATPIAVELSEPATLRASIDEIKKLGRPLDGIICNAGIMALPKLEQKHGIEMQFLTNHIGHFILVTGLLDILADNGRVVALSSTAHNYAPREGIDFDNLSGERGYSAWKSYGRSKLANLLFAKHLAKKFKGTNRTANALHPGVIKTQLWRHMSPLAYAGIVLAGPFGLKTIAQGAATECYLAAHPDVAATSGEYFADCNPAEPSRLAQNEALAEKLWTVSEELAVRLTAR